MSRIGNRIITIPENVTVSVDGTTVTVKGPKGELSTEIHKDITVNIEGNELKLTRKDDTVKNFHGTANANIKNMIVGVTTGYEKKLETIGVGYRFALKGNVLVVTAGYSHPVPMEIPEGVKVTLTNATEAVIEGANKQVVGQFAAEIRAVRGPEPYLGKGIRYKDEIIRRKEGKKNK